MQRHKLNKTEAAQGYYSRSFMKRVFLAATFMIFSLAPSLALAQTPVTVQHALAGAGVCKTSLATCTVTVAATGVGNVLMLGIAAEGDNRFPVIASVTGDSTWTHGTNCYGTHQNNSEDHLFSDCYYILSSAGGATSISVTFANFPSNEEGAQDVEFWEVSCPGCTAAYDASNSVPSSNCSNCAGPILDTTGTSDAILQVACLVDSYESVKSPYTLLNVDGPNENAFSGIINNGSGAAADWVQTSDQGGVFSALAIKFTFGGAPPPPPADTPLRVSTASSTENTTADLTVTAVTAISTTASSPSSATAPPTVSTVTSTQHTTAANGTVTTVTTVTTTSVPAKQ
jgi:hypothetical protein